MSDTTSRTRPTTTPYEGRAAAPEAPRSVPGCLAVLVALAVVVGGFYFARHQGRRAASPTSSPTPRTTPGPARAGHLRGRGGRQRRRDGARPEGARASSPPCRRSSNAADAEPDSTGIQVGFYELKKEMAAADALDVLLDPENILQGHRHDPRGAAGRRHRRRRWPKNTDFSAGAVREGAGRPRQRSGCPTTPRATPRATCSPRPTTSARTRRRRIDASRHGRPLASRRPTRPTSRRAAEELGYTPARADDGGQPGRGRGRPRRGPRQGRAGDLQPARPATRPTGCSRSTRRSTTRPTTSSGAVPTTEDLEIDSPYNTYLGAGAAAGSDRGTGRRGDRGGGQPEPRGTGTTTSPSTSGPARPSSRRPTTSSWPTRTSCATTARPSPRAPAEAPCAAPSWVTRSPTRCLRCCTARRTPRSGLDWSYDAHRVPRGRAGGVRRRARRRLAWPVA